MHIRFFYRQEKHPFAELSPPELIPNFKPYNREREQARRERELKEQQWEQELLKAMSESVVASP